MRVNSLALAAGASLLVHLMALVVPGLHAPDDETLGGTPISAVLLALPAGETQVPAPKPRPKPPKPKKPAPPILDAPTAGLGDQLLAANTGSPSSESSPDNSAQSMPIGQSAALPSPVAAQSAAVEAQSLPQAQAPALAGTPPMQSLPLAGIDAWARQGRVRYISSYYGLPISGEQIWSHDDTQFSASLRGSVPIKGELIRQESSGRIVAGRPVSDSFRETFNSAQYETHFDAAGNKVRQIRKGTAREVETGGYALDMLALTHFMALQPVGGENFDVFVVSFRGSVSRVSIEQRPAHIVELPVGAVIARQFHAEARNGSLKIDVWLAVDWRNAPVRIRVEDAGGTYDLKAEEVEVNGDVVGRRPSTPAAND
ncbi:MAG: hypothetical protein JWM03_623 [Rhodocyclales bacterium]|nr:hypothetical protein [Rhodocyclales bacterium]